ncbi:hypothetical protein OTU49_005741 [Cherax quadricarinatus]|uniref:Sec1 family domain-containing protein 2 n=1 Tax=Cherax quadricarinatus TaxID=27406 RepID=A0AAW0X6D2_CHEQU
MWPHWVVLICSHKDEYALTNRLSHAIVEDKKLLSDVLLQLVGQEVDEVSALRSAQCIAEQLHAIASARDHLKNYNLFVSVSKPMPRDTPTMLVFVVGGVTPGEVFEIQQVVTAVNPPCEVIVASTHFAHPTDSVINTLQPNPFLRHVLRFFLFLLIRFIIIFT